MDNKKSKFNVILFTTLTLLLLLGIGYVSFTSHAPENSEDMSAISATTPETAASKHIGKAGPAMSSDWSNVALTALNDVDISARIQAVLELRKRHSLEAVELLAKFLDDADSVVIAEAIDALGHIALNSGLTDDVFIILKEKAMDKNFSSHGQALITAAMLGKDDLILPVIDDYISEKDKERMSYAVRAMSFVATPKCIPLLKTVLGLSKDTEIQRNAFIILAKISTPEAIGLLKEYVLSLDAEEQLNSTWASSRLNKDEYNSILIDAIEQDELDENAIGIIATSPAAPEVFGELFQNDTIENERKMYWQSIISKDEAYTPKEIPVYVPPGPPSMENLSELQTDSGEDIPDGWGKLPTLFDDEGEQRPSFVAWKAGFLDNTNKLKMVATDPKSTDAEKAQAKKELERAWNEMRKATEHPDTFISARASEFINTYGSQ